MMSSIYRAVRGAVTAFQSRPVSPSGHHQAPTRTKTDPDLVSKLAFPTDMMRYSFAQRAAFNTEMGAQLDESGRELDLVADKLRLLRSHVVNLRNQLAASQSATEATWTQVKYGFEKGCVDLHDGVRNAAHWTSGVRDT